MESAEYDVQWCPCYQGVTGRNAQSSWSLYGWQEIVERMRKELRQALGAKSAFAGPSHPPARLKNE